MDDEYRYYYRDKNLYTLALADIRKGVEKAISVFENIDCRIKRFNNEEIDYYQTTVYLDRIGKELVYEISGFEPIPGWGSDYEIRLFVGEYDIDGKEEIEE